MKRDCIVITRFASDQPGFLDFSYRIAALAKIYRVTVVSAGPITQSELIVDSVDYLVLPQREGRLGWFAYLWACTRLIRRARPACVLLLHSLVAPLALLTGRTPAVLYWNEHPSRFTASPPGHPLIKRWARMLTLRWFYMGAARKAALVMPIGEAHRDDLLQNGCDPARITLIYMGVDRSFAGHSAYPVDREESTPLELIYNGTVSKGRGRDIMLEGLALANQNGQIARLTIVGASAEQIDYCNVSAQQLGIADAVRVRGRVPGFDIPPLLRQADAGICATEDLPWWRFNPPTKLFEYLAAGVPVLASDICTHTQYVSNWRNGLIFDYDSGSLAEAIRALWLRRGELPLLKQRARQSGQQYIWDRIEPEFLQAVHRVSHP